MCAKVVPSNIIIAELFSLLRGGEIDGVPVDKDYLGLFSFQRMISTSTFTSYKYEE